MKLSGDKVLISIVLGAVAGGIASVPMAGVMRWLQKRLPRPEQGDLPPQIITERAASRVGLQEQVVDEGKAKRLTWAAHLGYGAAIGSIYPLLTGWLRAPVLMKGFLFALLVWSGSYLGWLPVTGLYPSANDEPPGRNKMMVISHLVWGGVTGILVDQMARKAVNR